MGRLIDADAFKKKVCTYQQTGCGDCKHSLCCPEDAPTVDAIPKADYENRLKADMVAMLTEIQLEIEEMENPYTTRVSGCAQSGFERGARESQNLIQQKINSLKEARNDREKDI